MVSRWPCRTKFRSGRGNQFCEAQFDKCLRTCQDGNVCFTKRNANGNTRISTRPTPWRVHDVTVEDVYFVPFSAHVGTILVKPTNLRIDPFGSNKS